MVLGTPTTEHLDLFFKKYSANKQAFVFESSPPITTRPSKFKWVAVLRLPSNYSSVSILCLPALIISNPPMLLYRAIYSPVISI